MPSLFSENWKTNNDYFELLRLVASLSNLFSESDIPLLYYRVPENLFCKCYHAGNLAREDDAFDATFNTKGVGIKTFIMTGDSSSEKVAEFGRISNDLDAITDPELLARKLAQVRNIRMEAGLQGNALTDCFYHIVSRNRSGLRIFNTTYPFINENNLSNIVSTSAGLQFNDGDEHYNYNRSKHTLLRTFRITDDYIDIPVTIEEDPYELLKNLLYRQPLAAELVRQYDTPPADILGVNYVILPLYSTRQNDVPPRSGLNQWNANGRPRDYNEVYISIPAAVRNAFPSFFPERSRPFTMHLPNGSSIEMIRCQDGGKALMSTDNSILGNWLLRDILHLAEGEIATMSHLALLGFDSVVIHKIDEENYRINTSRISYSSLTL